MAWQPDGWNDDMSEAPRDGTRILLHFPGWVGDGVVEARFDDFTFGRPVWDGGEWFDDIENATHWRYLPSPPSKQED